MFQFKWCIILYNIYIYIIHHYILCNTVMHTIRKSQALLFWVPHCDRCLCHICGTNDLPGAASKLSHGAMKHLFITSNSQGEVQLLGSGAFVKLDIDITVTLLLHCYSRKPHSVTQLNATLDRILTCWQRDIEAGLLLLAPILELCSLCFGGHII